MRNIMLEQVRKGERFVLDGVAFIKLDEDREASFVVAEDVVIKNIPFDDTQREERNNLIGSKIHYALDEWASLHETLYDAALERPIDLLSMDGMDDYGRPELAVRILTVDEYRKYRNLIPLTDEAYWLATSWTTPSSPNSDTDYAYCVNSSGTLSNYGVLNAIFAARPAFYLKSSISVSVESEEGDEQDVQGLISYSLADLLKEIVSRVEA